MPKVVLNPRHFRVRSKREDGSIWLTHEKVGDPVRPVRDITNEVLLCLCADLNAVDGTDKVERSVKFADGFECLVTVQVINRGEQ
jgi:hypothetical protein